MSDERHPLLRASYTASRAQSALHSSGMLRSERWARGCRGSASVEGARDSVISLLSVVLQCFVSQGGRM